MEPIELLTTKSCWPQSFTVEWLTVFRAVKDILAWQITLLVPLKAKS